MLSFKSADVLILNCSKSLMRRSIQDYGLSKLVPVICRGKVVIVNKRDIVLMLIIVSPFLIRSIMLRGIELIRQVQSLILKDPLERYTSVRLDYSLAIIE